jgi:hypothetical protein
MHGSGSDTSQKGKPQKRGLPKQPSFFIAYSVHRHKGVGEALAK